MTARRWKAAGIAVICFAAGGINGWFAVVDLSRLAHGFSDGAPVISSAHYALTGLFLTPVAIAIGLLLLLARQATPEEMKEAAAKGSRGGGALLIFVLVCIVAALLAPMIQFQGVDHLAGQRGYVACPTPDWPRHQPDRWARPAGHGTAGLCPGNGADPNR